MLVPFQVINGRQGVGAQHWGHPSGLRGVLSFCRLGGVIFFWVGGFDIIYACQDSAFDSERKLHSIPARFGIAGALRIAFVSHIATIAMLLILWHFTALGTVFLCGVIALSLLLLYQHWLVSPTDLQRVNIAFFNVNAIVSFGLLLVGCLDIWLRHTST